MNNRKKIISLFLCLLLVVGLFSAQSFAEDNRLAEYSGVHPRVFLDQEKFDTLKSQAGTGNYAKIWAGIEQDADTYASQMPPDWSDDINQGENLWISEWGEKLSTLCFAYKVTSDETKKAAYKAAATGYVNQLVSYPVWASRGATENNELGGQGAFLGIALYYDWLYHDLTQEERDAAVNALSVRGEDMIDGGWWKTSWLQNHMTVCWSSLFAAAAAIYDVYPAAEGWMTKISEGFQKTLDLFPADGAGYEGHMYWTNSMRGLTAVARMSDQFLNTQMSNLQVFENAAEWGIYNAIPRNAWRYNTDQFNGGDAPVYSYYAMANFMAAVASDTSSPVIQWYVNQCIDRLYNWRNQIHAPLSWQLMIYYNPAVQEQAPSAENMPLDKTFSDTGYTYLRSGWDGSEDVVAFRSGKVMGQKAAEYMAVPNQYDLGAGHQHPDINSPSIFANGEWLLQDDGYVTGSTGQHNTLLVGGEGQLGDLPSMSAAYGLDQIEMNKLWYQADPSVIKVESYPAFTYVVSDGTGSYHPQSGLEKFYRHFIYLKEQDTLLVLDEVEVQGEKELTLRWRPKADAITPQADGSYLCQSSASSLRILPFDESGADIEYTILPVYTGKNVTGNDQFIQMSKTAESWTQATALTWSGSSSVPASVKLRKTADGVYEFVLNDKKISVNPSSQTVELLDPVQVEYDWNTNSVKISGMVSGNTETPVTAAVTSPTGENIYSGQIPVSADGSYETSIQLNGFGVYTVNVSHPSYGRSFSMEVEATEPDLPGFESIVDVAGQTLQITGNLGLSPENRLMTVRVTAPDQSVIYINEFSSGEDGGYAVNAAIGPLQEGNYKVELYSAAYGKVKTQWIPVTLQGQSTAKISAVEDGFEAVATNCSAEAKELGLILAVYNQDGTQLVDIKTIYEVFSPGECKNLCLPYDPSLLTDKTVKTFVWDSNLQAAVLQP